MPGLQAAARGLRPRALSLAHPSPSGAARSRQQSCQPRHALANSSAPSELDSQPAADATASAAADLPAAMGAVEQPGPAVQSADGVSDGSVADVLPSGAEPATVLERLTASTAELAGGASRILAEISSNLASTSAAAAPEADARSLEPPHTPHAQAAGMVNGATSTAGVSAPDQTTDVNRDGSGARASATAADSAAAAASGAVVDPLGSVDLEIEMSSMYDIEVGSFPDVGVLLLATAVGLSTGAGVVLFNSLIHTVQDDVIWTDAPRIAAFGSFFLRRDPTISLWQYLLLPPIVGGVAVSVLRAAAGGFEGDPKSVKMLPPTGAAGGAGAAEARPAFAVQLGEWLPSARAALRPYIKFLAAALTLGSGASLGPEGPSVDLGKANASSIASVARMRDQRVTTDLLAAGAGAGVAAGFGAPMAGVVFAVETVLLSKRAAPPPPPPQRKGKARAAEEMTTDDGGLLITTVLIACVIASIITRSGLGVEAALRVPEYDTLRLSQLPLFIALGLLCGGTSSAIMSLMRSTERSLVRLRLSGVPGPVMPMLGGLACGSLAMVYPEITYQGFENINALLRLSSGPGALYSATVLMQLVAVKGIATAICRASGLVGGLYAPSLFLGAAVGAAYCQALQALAQQDMVTAALVQLGPDAVITISNVDLLPDSTGFALVGAAAMLAAKCKVPLTSVLLLFELTQDYTIVIPTLATVGIARWASATVDKKIRPQGLS